jgi:PAS domain S-box-containing protein
VRGQETKRFEAMFAGPGDLRALCRSLDWGATAAGPVACWSPSLRTAVRMCLDAPMLMAICAVPNLALVYNDGYAALLGPARHPRALGRSAREIWSGAWQWLEADVEKVIGRGESAARLEQRLLLERGGVAEEEAFVAYSLTPIREDDGRVVGVVNVMVEITERVRADTERTAVLEAIIQSSHDAIFAKDLSGRMLLANPTTMSVIGKPAEQILGKTDVEFLDDEEQARQVMANDRRVLETGQSIEAEEVVQSPDGTPHTWQAAKVPYRDASGHVIGLLAIARDITDRKHHDSAERRAEEAVRASEIELREAQRLARLGSWRWVVGGEITWSEGLFQILGRDLALGPPTLETLPQFYTAEGWSRLGPAIARAAETGAPYELELEMIRQDGTRFWSITRGEAVRGPTGAIEKLRGTSHDITERKRAEQERERLVAALSETDQRKNEFLGVLSHELRNPLTPIRNSLGILQRATPGGDQDRRARAVIDRQVHQLTRLVDDLLDITRISRGKIRLQTTRLDFVDLVRQAVDDHQSLLEGREVTVALPAPPIWVLGDPTRLTQTIGNLLQNAAKFTSRGGKISISLARTGSRAVVEVADTGRGIEPDLLPRIFEPFVQAEHSLARTGGGLGLGLALVKGLVEQHGGTVKVSSEGPGKGARFTLDIPLDEQVASRAEEHLPQTVTGNGLKVLVIEDNVDAADSLAAVLDLDGYDVRVSYSAHDGIAKARESRPDVLLCDVGLPEMDGYDVARAFRSDPALRDVYLVALTGYAGPEDQHRAAEAGFQRHLPKPPDLAALEQLLATKAAKADLGAPALHR